MSTALLIVHGIGEQKRGETTDKLVNGLVAAFGEQLAVTRKDQHAIAVTARGVTVHFYEVYWADLLDRKANKDAFTWSTLPTLVWHPLLCRRAKLLPSAEYPAVHVIARLALTLPASLLAYPMALGARPFVQSFDRDFKKRQRERLKDVPFLQRPGIVADSAAHDDTIVEATIEGVVADVPNYMNSAARGEGVAFSVLARFHEAMSAARREHDDIHILAHSLGTVVAYHALSGMGQPPGDPPYAPRRLYTIGSPLGKIRFFWPWTIRCATPSAHPDFRWSNFHHGWDAVSGALRRFESWAPLTSIRLKGGGGVLRSHVVYERSPEFLGLLTEELFGERTVPPVAWWRRLLDRVITTGENLAAPVAVLASLAMGAGVMVIALLGFPYLVSLVLRLIGAGTWAGQVADGLSLLFVLTMAVFLLGELRRCYRTACANVAAGQRSSIAGSDSPRLGV